MKKFLYFFRCPDCKVNHKMRDLASTEDPSGLLHYYCPNHPNDGHVPIPAEEGWLFKLTMKTIEVDRTSCEAVAEYRNPNKYYVLVTRHYPMAFRKRALRTLQAVDIRDISLAPSTETLGAFKLVRDWEGYKRAFFEDVPKAHIIKVMSKHLRVAKGKPVILVCQEEDGDPHCHTHLIINIVSNAVFTPTFLEGL